MLFQKCKLCGNVLTEEELKSLEKFILLNSTPSCISCQNKTKSQLLKG